MVMNIRRRLSNHPRETIQESYRYLGATNSRGAIAGGFTRQALLNFAQNHWNMPNISSISNSRRRSFPDNNESAPYYSDLFSHKVSIECSNWIEKRTHPSVTLARSFFGSWRFLPERILLTPLLFVLGSGTASSCLKKLESNPFSVKDTHLVWTVEVQALHELILHYTSGSVRGLTTVAFDPALRKVYHGNCIEVLDSEDRGKAWGIMVSFHRWYAQFLLRGMVLDLEHKANIDQE